MIILRIKSLLTGLITGLLVFFTFKVIAQCPDELPGVIWTSNHYEISYQDLAEHCAPMLWFSPDEPKLLGEDGKIRVPHAFPFDDTKGTVVYYKVKTIYTKKKKKAVQGLVQSRKLTGMIDLRDIEALDMEYYLYFPEEFGLGDHPHDLESVAVQLRVNKHSNCPGETYSINAVTVIARAHGLHWFENRFKVDESTKFPLSILVEEGKHGLCTDKNADGIYTPSYDVTEKVNDAWGVRDIISSGVLFTGGFQGFMAKVRTPNTILFPPFPALSPHYAHFKERYNEELLQNTYTLKSYPDYPPKPKDEKLNKFMKSKKPHQWPKPVSVGGKGVLKQWAKEDKSLRFISISYRFDEDNTPSIAFPLLIVKNVPAPITGGWFYNKIYFGNDDSVGEQINRLIGHQIVHSTSASRWLDSYVAGGYEILDTNFEKDKRHYKAYFVSEIGLKIRINITKTPLKFLRHLGTEYWGVRLGWKNLGFNPFIYSGFVLEIGAGVF